MWGGAGSESSKIAQNNVRSVCPFISVYFVGQSQIIGGTKPTIPNDGKTFKDSENIFPYENATKKKNDV